MGVSIAFNKAESFVNVFDWACLERKMHARDGHNLSHRASYDASTWHQRYRVDPSPSPAAGWSTQHHCTPLGSFAFGGAPVQQGAQPALPCLIWQLITLTRRQNRHSLPAADEWSATRGEAEGQAEQPSRLECHQRRTPALCSTQ